MFARANPIEGLVARGDLGPGDELRRSVKTQVRRQRFHRHVLKNILGRLGIAHDQPHRCGDSRPHRQQRLHDLLRVQSHDPIPIRLNTRAATILTSNITDWHGSPYRSMSYVNVVVEK
jgi:hypothetical protein